MKKRSAAVCVMAAVIILFTFIPVFSSDYFPMGDGYAWTYEGYMKNTPKKKLVVTASIIKKEKISGLEYYYYSAPSVDVRFLVRVDGNYGYMKVLKYPFPVLKFVTVDVYLTPEIQFIKLPYKAGDTWEQKINAEVELTPFKLNQGIKVKFTVLDPEKFVFKGREYEVFHVRMVRDEGNNNIRIEDNWFADGLGFVRGETPEYFIEIKDFVKGK
jgi:hypothetical protein